jgi:hypothetical protein
MDEALLDEQRKAEALEAAVEEVRRSSAPSEGIKERPIEVLEPSANTDWFGMEGDGNE